MRPRLDLPVEWAGQVEDGERLLMQERATSAVRPDCVATFIYGGKAAVARRLKAFAFIESDPIFSTADRIYGDQDSKYMRASEKAVHLVKKGQALGLSYDDIAACFNYALDEVTPVDVHMKMVVPVLMHQTTPEQRARWLPLAQRFEITCAYAQTELGHGSNVQVRQCVGGFGEGNKIKGFIIFNR
jgi:acyl-CoA oxidase